MKTFLKVLISVFIIILTLASISAGLFWYNWSQNAAATVSDIKIEKTDLNIGEPTELLITVQTPWYRSVEKPIELSSDTVASLANEITLTRSGFNLSGYTWEVKASLIAFEKGALKDLSMSIGLSPDREKKQKSLIVTIPEITVTPSGFSKTSDVTFKNNMNAADLLKFEKDSSPTSKTWLIPAIIAFILIIIAVIMFIKSNKSQVRILSPWEIARKSLAELKKELTVNDEAFFVRLSDILRMYIERRFALPATEKTSEEFIQQLRTDSILSKKQRLALERFLGTADLVKFAKMNSDEKQKNECLEMADSFVDETIPQQLEVAQ